MNRQIILVSALGSLIVAFIVGVFWSVMIAVIYGVRNILPEALLVAAGCFALFFILIVFELTSWSALVHDKRKAKPSH
jgi:ABC-type multidrug transport system permease subunit